MLVFTSLHELQKVLTGDINELDHYMTGIPNWIMHSFDTRVFSQLDEAEKTAFIKRLLTTPNGKSALLSAIPHNNSLLELIVKHDINLAVFASDRDLDVIRELRLAHPDETVDNLFVFIMINCTLGIILN